MLATPAIPRSKRNSTMSSATSTESAPFQTWHFFVLAALVAATAAVLLSSDPSPSTLILTSLGIGAASAAGLALVRTLGPLAGGELPERDVRGRAAAALEREKMLVLRSIKELEFDRAMGKVSEADFAEMSQRLRARAIGLMRQLDEGGYRELVERDVRARLERASVRAATAPEIDAQPASAPAIRSVTGTARLACQSCGTSNDPDSRFCKQCGHRLGEDVAG
jgi:hypothetical protein